MKHRNSIIFLSSLSIICVLLLGKQLASTPKADSEITSSEDHLEKKIAELTFEVQSLQKQVDQVNSSTNVLSKICSPIGTVLPFAGIVPTNPQAQNDWENESGWMLCNGRAVITAEYAELFEVIGRSYGASANTFNIPDMRGRVAVGKNDMGGEDAKVLTQGQKVRTEIDGNELGARGGKEVHSLKVEEMPSHSHSVMDEGHFHEDLKVVGGSGGSHNGILDRGFHGRGVATQKWNTVVWEFPGKANIKESEMGNNEPHTNIQPSIILNYIIRYRSDKAN